MKHDVVNPVLYLSKSWNTLCEKASASSPTMVLSLKLSTTVWLLSANLLDEKILALL